MKTYLFTFSLALLIIFGTITPSSATQVAAGEMRIVNVDTDPTDNIDEIQVLITLVKQCGPNVSDVNPSIPVVFVPNVACGLAQFNATANLWTGGILGGIDYQPGLVPVDSCVVTTKLCQMEVYYYKTATIQLNFCKWNIYWEETFRPVSSQNLVAPDINAMHIENFFDNSRPYYTVTTKPTGTPPNRTCEFIPTNNSPVFDKLIPVESFCVGKEYNYYVDATDPDGDYLEYEMTNARGADGVPIASIPGYSSQFPFPGLGISFDKTKGILTFTPDMVFESSVVFKIYEYRDSCVHNPITDFLTTQRVLVGTTLRDVRFVFEDVCNTETVDFLNVTPHPFDPDPTPVEVIPNLLEYDCAPDSMPIVLSYPLQCESIDLKASDFRLVKGDVKNPDKLYPINSVKVYCDDGLTTKITLYLYTEEREDRLSAGNYKLFIKTGDDFNTVRTKCGVELPEYREIDVLINNKAKNIEFDVEDLAACRPEGDPPIAEYEIVGDFYVWAYKGNIVDDGEFGELDSSSTWVTDSAGMWTVQIDKSGCVYTDTFKVTIYNSIPLPEIPNFDLCISEPFPLIDTMRKYLDILIQQGKTVYGHQWTLYSNQNPKGEVVGFLDTLQAVIPGRYIFSVVVDSCVLSEEFIIKRRTNLNVDIGDDIVRCQGDPADVLRSKEDFNILTSDFKYKWYKDGVEVPDSTGLSFVAEESGEYIFEVYKPIPSDPTNSYCSGRDTVDVLIVDTLTQPQPFCESISFYRGQKFFWPEIPNAESYEVSPDKVSWGPANGTDTLNSHRAAVQLKQLYVRAVNEEVDETYWCKYSPVNVAQQCEVIIKAPNIFTPNGDGVNDLLMFNLIEVFPGSHLQIYNRWGRLVYESTDYKNDWNGGDSESGTYFYILDINDDGQELQKGTFTLMR